MVHRILLSFFVSSFLSVFVLTSPHLASAATFRTGETLTIDQTLTDLYATGGSVTVNAPITNDLTVAGGTVTIDAPVSGGVLASGGTVNIESTINQTLRAAGGTINLRAPIGRDAILFGGSITVSESASISGDLIINGGSVTIQAPVTGNVVINAGAVVLNSSVGGNVTGNVERLVLGNQAVIMGNLDYTSPQRAVLRDGAIISGIENFKQADTKQKGEKIAGLFTNFSLYKLVADILGSLAIIYLLYAVTRRILDKGSSEPVKAGLLGFLTLIVAPIIGILLLFLILPGIVILIMYLLLLILSAFLSKLLLGKFALTWWYKRNNKKYELDWKSAVIGPILMFILMLIPVIGWFISFLVYLAALGSVMVEMYSWISSPKATPVSSWENTSIKAAVTKKTMKRRRS